MAMTDPVMEKLFAASTKPRLKCHQGNAAFAQSSRRIKRTDGRQLFTLCLGLQGEIMMNLQIHPEFGRGAEKPGKAQRRIDRHRCGLASQPLDPRTGHPKPTRERTR